MNRSRDCQEFHRNPQVNPLTGSHMPPDSFAYSLYVKNCGDPPGSPARSPLPPTPTEEMQMAARSPHRIVSKSGVISVPPPLRSPAHHPGVQMPHPAYSPAAVPPPVRSPMGAVPPPAYSPAAIPLPSNYGWGTAPAPAYSPRVQVPPPMKSPAATPLPRRSPMGASPAPAYSPRVQVPPPVKSSAALPSMWSPAVSIAPPQRTPSAVPPSVQSPAALPSMWSAPTPMKSPSAILPPMQSIDIPPPVSSPTVAFPVTASVGMIPLSPPRRASPPRQASPVASPRRHVTPPPPVSPPRLSSPVSRPASPIASPPHRSSPVSRPPSPVRATGPPPAVSPPRLTSPVASPVASPRRHVTPPPAMSPPRLTSPIATPSLPALSTVSPLFSRPASPAKITTPPPPVSPPRLASPPALVSASPTTSIPASPASPARQTTSPSYIYFSPPSSGSSDMDNAMASFRLAATESGALGSQLAPLPVLRPVGSATFHPVNGYTSSEGSMASVSMPSPRPVSSGPPPPVSPPRLSALPPQNTISFIPFTSVAPVAPSSMKIPSLPASPSSTSPVLATPSSFSTSDRYLSQSMPSGDEFLYTPTAQNKEYIEACRERSRQHCPSLEMYIAGAQAAGLFPELARRSLYPQYLERATPFEIFKFYSGPAVVRARQLLTQAGQSTSPALIQFFRERGYEKSYFGFVVAGIQKSGTPTPEEVLATITTPDRLLMEAWRQVALHHKGHGVVQGTEHLPPISMMKEADVLGLQDLMRQGWEKEGGYRVQLGATRGGFKKEQLRWIAMQVDEQLVNTEGVYLDRATLRYNDDDVAVALNGQGNQVDIEAQPLPLNKGMCKAYYLALFDAITHWDNTNDLRATVGPAPARLPRVSYRAIAASAVSEA